MDKDEIIKIQQLIIKILKSKYQSMSLYIVGSCSRITRNIVFQLAKNNQYQNITIGDLLPVYQFHDRFYQLKRQLSDQKSNLKLNLDKLIQPSQLYSAVTGNNDVLFVTHDYYTNVTSKTKLMRLVAQYGKNKSHLFYATPLEYDHYGYANPQQNYLNAQNQVKSINPNATVIRSDIQDKTQFFAYFNHSKNIWEDQLMKLSARKGLAPRVVSAQKYAETVANTLRDRVQGKVLLVQGQAQIPAQNVDFNRSLDKIDWCHAQQNIRNLAGKYTGVLEGGQKLLVSL